MCKLLVRVMIAAVMVLGWASLSIAQIELPSIPGAGSKPAKVADQPTEFGDSRDQVAVSIVPSQSKVAPGSDLIIAIVFDHQAHWHIHTNDPKVPKELGDPDDYIKTEIFVEAPAGGPFTAHTGFAQWPKPQAVKVAFFGTPVNYEVFQGKAVVFVPVTVAANAPLGKAKIRIRPVFQACDDTMCMAPTPQPDSADWLTYGHEVTIEVVDPTTLAGTTTAPNKDVFADFDPSVWAKIHSGQSPPKVVKFDLFGVIFTLDAGSTIGLILLLLVAALGGLLLNFTPCVLPVIPIKIISLSQSAGNRRRTLVLGIAMFLGVIAFWMALGLAIATISGFTATNQLFQYPIFTITVGIIIAAMAIGMCGLFSIRLPQFVYFYNPGHDTAHGSFMFGIMTAILSTPCTAPFMGAAAAWAATQSPSIILTVFFSIGFGMGLPYFILSAFPKLVEKMPRTGPASELIKQLMGLLMLAAAAYFIGVGLSGVLVTPPEPPGRLYLWVVAALVIAAGAWLAYRTIQITHSAGKRVTFAGLGVLLVAFAIYAGVRLTEKGPINWVYFTPERFAQAKKQGNTVVMEFTAEWCLNCKALESTVLSHPKVVSLLAEKNVTPIKVDLTNYQLGNEMLTSVQRRSIPLLVVFAPDGSETFKGDFYTVDQVVAAVREAQGKQVAINKP